MSIAYNFDQAPWGQGTRHWQLRESLLTHLDTMQPEQDPLFMALLPYILDDLRRNGDAMEPDIAEQLWQELKSVDCVWKRGTPLSFSKFMGAQVKNKGVSEVVDHPLVPDLDLGIVMWQFASGQV